MPLYASGMKRLSVMRLALAANDWLARRRMMHLRRLCACRGAGHSQSGRPGATSDGARRRASKGRRSGMTISCAAPSAYWIETCIGVCGSALRALNYARVEGVE